MPLRLEVHEAEPGKAARAEERHRERYRPLIGYSIDFILMPADAYNEHRRHIAEAVAEALGAS